MSPWAPAALSADATLVLGSSPLKFRCKAQGKQWGATYFPHYQPVDVKATISQLQSFNELPCSTVISLLPLRCNPQPWEAGCYTTFRDLLSPDQARTRSMRETIAVMSVLEASELSSFASLSFSGPFLMPKPRRYVPPTHPLSQLAAGPGVHHPALLSPLRHCCRHRAAHSHPAASSRGSHGSPSLRRGLIPTSLLRHSTACRTGKALPAHRCSSPRARQYSRQCCRTGTASALPGSTFLRSWACQTRNEMGEPA